MQGIWGTPIKAKTLLKGLLVFLGAFVVAVCALEALVSYNMTPLKERKLITNFQAHRAAYERLRTMLLEDHQVSEVSTKGIETPSSLLLRQPSEVNLQGSRYNEYVAMLNEIGRGSAFRMKERESNLICVVIRGAGWAGDTRHQWLCWTDKEPANQVKNLDEYYRDPNRPRNVSRHIDGNWYLQADW